MLAPPLFFSPGSLYVEKQVQPGPSHLTDEGNGNHIFKGRRKVKGVMMMMRPMRAFVLLLLTTAGLLCTASAQTLAPLVEWVAASVPAREAGWRLVEKQINPSDGSPSGSGFRWTDGSAEVSASVEIHPSLKAARDSFGGLPRSPRRVRPAAEGGVGRSLLLAVEGARGLGLRLPLQEGAGRGLGERPFGGVGQTLCASHRGGHLG